MKEITIYTSKTCGYCKKLKEVFNSNDIKFIEKNNEDYQSDWIKIQKLTGLSTWPTTVQGNNYYIPGRDYNKNFAIVLKDLDTAIMTHVKNVMKLRMWQHIKNLFTVQSAEEEPKQKKFNPSKRIDGDKLSDKEKMDKHFNGTTFTKDGLDNDF